MKITRLGQKQKKTEKKESPAHLHNRGLTNKSRDVTRSNCHHVTWRQPANEPKYYSRDQNWIYWCLTREKRKKKKNWARGPVISRVISRRRWMADEGLFSAKLKTHPLLFPLEIMQMNSTLKLCKWVVLLLSPSPLGPFVLIFRQLRSIFINMKSNLSLPAPENCQLTGETRAAQPPHLSQLICISFAWEEPKVNSAGLI